MPFARGGVVSAPTAFPMRGGTGLMGEAGPEAIMPLRRGPDGRLGVEMAGGAAPHVTVTMNVTTPDAASFRRSRTQIAAEMSRALARGARNR
jgi:phage-related minor tail protein